MDSSSDEIIKEIPGFIRLYKDGRCQRFIGNDTVFAGDDLSTGVQSKDVVISPETPLSVRIYIPKTSDSDQKKLPLLIFYHGGGFIIETPASPVYHNFLNLISSESNAVVVSVDYRRAPEHPISACFDDSWDAIKWVAKHATGNGPDPWLNEYPDLGRVFFAGDSAGANISHHMAIRVGSESPGVAFHLQGIILLHPYFSGKDRVGLESDDHPWALTTDKVWMMAHPGTSGLDDPIINPAKDPKLSGLGCSKVLVYVAEKDYFRYRGWNYKDVLIKSGWRGEIEVVEDKGVDHVYFLHSHSAESACTMRKGICTFINSKD